MVSAKNNGTSQDKAIIRNKDGSIRKIQGRKPQNMVPRARTSFSEGNVSQASSSFDRINNTIEKDDVIMESEQEVQLPVGRQVINDFMNSTESMFNEMKDEREALKQERQQEREELKQELALLRNQISTRNRSPVPSSDRRLVVQSIQRSLPDTSITTEYTSKPDENMQLQSMSACNDPHPPRGHNRMNEICGYKMKIEKFNGSAGEDYDVWWDNLNAFFDLYSFTEKEKVSLFNAHLGNAARKYVHNVNLREMATVQELHKIFSKTFSDQYDWHNILMTIKQKSDEKIRDYAVRLRIAATKIGLKGQLLEETCTAYIKTTCLPMFQTIMSTVLPHTSFEIIVEHAIQFERAQEAKTELEAKKPAKRKCDDICNLSENNHSIEKKIKEDYSNTIQQLKDQMNTNVSHLAESIQSLNDRVGNSYSNPSNSYSNPSRYANSNNNRYGNSSTAQTHNTNKYNDRPKRIRVCFHCAKPNHNFNECRSASPLDKNVIAKALTDKKFDYVKLSERANALSNRFSAVN